MPPTGSCPIAARRQSARAADARFLLPHNDAEMLTHTTWEMRIVARSIRVRPIVLMPDLINELRIGIGSHLMQRCA
jgi:hypothetical protein